jgi:hypothetical protein
MMPPLTNKSTLIAVGENGPAIEERITRRNSSNERCGDHESPFLSGQHHILPDCSRREGKAAQRRERSSCGNDFEIDREMGSSTLNDELQEVKDSQLLHYLSDLISTQDWETVFDSLFNKGDGRASLSESHALNFERATGHNLLHVLCRHQPPLEMVQAVITTWPFLPPKLTKKTRQAALHIACQHGARSDVVKLLLHSNGKAATLQDASGRLPLHLACCPSNYPRRQAENMCDEEKDTNEVEWINPGSAVIRALCAHFPQAVNMEDEDGCNPLELAFMGKAKVGKTMVKLILDTSQEIWEKEIKENTQRCVELDEAFTMPGYTASAARVLLARCRSNRSSFCSISGLWKASSSPPCGDENEIPEPKNVR